MTIRQFFILSILALAAACGQGGTTTPFVPTTDQESTSPAFDSSLSNPESTADLDFEFLHIPIPSEQLIQPYDWEALGPHAQPRLKSLENPGAVLFKHEAQVPTHICGENFDPLPISSKTSVVGDFALLRVYLCTETWKQRPSGFFIELDSLTWQCESSGQTNLPDPSCFVSLKKSEKKNSIVLPANYSSLLQSLVGLDLSENQIQFLLLHIESRLVPFSEEDVKRDQNFESPLYKNLPASIETSDRIEAFSFEDELLKTATQDVLTSYWDLFQFRSFNYYKSLADPEVLSELILRGNATALLKVSEAKALNTPVKTKGEGPLYTLKVAGGTLPRAGLTPLMIAGLSDQGTIAESLLRVPGVNPNVIASSYKATYKDLVKWTQEDFRNHPDYQPDSRAPKQGTRLQNITQTPPHDPKKDIVVQNECENCTPLMHLIYKNQCYSIETLSSKKDFDVNYRSSNGITALKVGMKLDRCLSDLVLVEGIDLKTDDVYLDWILEEKTPLLQSVPESFWAKLPQEKRDQALKLALNQINITRKNFENTFYFSKKQIIDTIKRSGLSGINLTPRGLSLLIFEYEINPFDLKDPDGTTLLDHFLAARNFQFLEKVRDKNPSWLTPWVNGQSFFGHNPLVVATVFSEVRVLEFLLTIPGSSFEVVDQATGLNAISWNSIVAHRAVNIFDKADNVGDFSQGLQFRYDIWTHILSSELTPTDLIYREREENGIEGLIETKKHEFSLTHYRSFFTENCPQKLNVDKSMEWLNCYPFVSYSKESRVILSEQSDGFMSKLKAQLMRRARLPRKQERYIPQGP